MSQKEIIIEWDACSDKVITMCLRRSEFSLLAVSHSMAKLDEDFITLQKKEKYPSVSIECID